MPGFVLWGYASSSQLKVISRRKIKGGSAPLDALPAGMLFKYRAREVRSQT